MKTNINYLRKIQYVQGLVKEQQKRYSYISLKKIWKNLRDENLYFESYNSFIRIMGEGNISKRIAKQNGESGS